MKTNGDVMKTTKSQLIAQYNEIAQSMNVATIETFNGTMGALRAKIDALRTSTTRRKRVLTNETHISLIDIARELSIDAKIARAKFRRIYATRDANDLPITRDENWVFSRDDIERVKTLLTSKS